jgi:MtfA peptidase
MMKIFSIFRGRGRSRRLAGVPDAEWEAAAKRHPAAARAAMEAGKGDAHRGLAAAFMREKQFLVSSGEAPRREDILAVAFNAVLPFLGIGPEYWRGWSSLFLLPGSFTERIVAEGKGGVIEEYDDEFSGEARELGPVLLSLEDLGDSGLGRGYNLPVHEMAHKIDGLDGEMDGCPPLDGKERAGFISARDSAFASFRRRAGTRGRGGRARGMSRSRLPLDEYGAEDEVEFFAVSAEAFFDRPSPLKREYPEWYASLARFFRLDPLGFTLKAPPGTMASGPAVQPAIDSDGGEPR